jgi:hypothetical protein
MALQRRPVFLVLLLGLLALIGLGVTTNRTRRNPELVYSVAAVQSGLTHDPAAWANRILLVRGEAVAIDCTMAPAMVLCGSPRFGLRDSDPAARREQLDLTWAGGTSLLSFLRRVPLLGAMVPAPQVIRWDAPAVYRVQLRIERPCSDACGEAVLLDAAAGVAPGP